MANRTITIQDDEFDDLESEVGDLKSEVTYLEDRVAELEEVNDELERDYFSLRMKWDCKDALLARIGEL